MIKIALLFIMRLIGGRRGGIAMEGSWMGVILFDILTWICFEVK